MAKETNPLTIGTWNALLTMRGVEGEITLNDLNENSDENIASAHMVQLMRNNLVQAEKRTFECDCCGHKTKRNVYVLTENGSLYTDENDPNATEEE